MLNQAHSHQASVTCRAVLHAQTPVATLHALLPQQSASDDEAWQESFLPNVSIAVAIQGTMIYGYMQQSAGQITAELHVNLSPGVLKQSGPRRLQQ
jgi:hypothetical protein